jgi:zinc transport system substrate-binding protein
MAAARKAGRGAAGGGVGVARALQLLAGSLVLLLPLSCSPRQPAGAAAQAPEQGIRVFVSILPQVTFVKEVGGDRVIVEALVRPGQDPHTFEPTGQQMARLARAAVFFRIGVPFENALIPRIQGSTRNLLIVDTQAGIPLRPLNEEAEHGEGGPDPHTWMSPLLVKRQAQTIRDALAELDPAGKQSYQANYERFAAELEALHQEIAAALAPFRGKDLFVYHAAYGYFADEFGLRQVAVEIGGAQPSARQLAGLIDRARQEGVKVIFVQPQFSPKGAETLAESIGGAVVPLDPLAEDYLGNMREMTRRIRQAFGEGGQGSP